ncbi:MAG: cupin domain-containing protein [Pseudomonas sp.]|uniref:cupin domain-containing protein n=1 Tax=Pseudomonas sp. TaxID=306 RepID=UPI0030F0DBF3
MIGSNSALNIQAALAQVSDYWSPQVVGQVNNQYIKVAKLKGELIWHAHADDDEMFMVVYGTLKIQFEDGDVLLQPGEFFVVPKQVRHNPVAEQECGIVLIETVTTQHTGDEQTSRTVPIAKQLGRHTAAAD